MLRRLTLCLSALAIVAAPVAAQQAVGSVARDAQPARQASQIGGESTTYFLAGIAAVVAAIVFLSVDDDPISP